MSAIFDADQEVQKVLLRFDACTQVEQRILQVFAVVYQFINQTDLKKILSLIDKTQTFNSVNLCEQYTPQMRRKFIDDHLIEAGSAGSRISGTLAHPLVKICTDRGIFTQLLKQVNSVILAKGALSWQQVGLMTKKNIRDHLYLGKAEQCEALFNFDKNPQIIRLNEAAFLIDLCFTPFDARFFDTLPATIQYQAFATYLYDLRLDNRDAKEVIALLQHRYDEGLCCDNMRLLLAENRLYLGQLTQASALLSEQEISAYGLSLRGWHACLLGDTHTALDFFERARAAKNKIARRKRQYLGGMPGLFYLLALLKQGCEDDPGQLTQLVTEVDNYCADKNNPGDEEQSYRLIQHCAQVFLGKSSRQSQNTANLVSTKLSSLFRYSDDILHLEILIGLLCCHWLQETPQHEPLDLLAKALAQALASGQSWYADTAASVLLHYHHSHANGSDFIKDEAELKVSLLDWIQPQAPWKQALELLIACDPNKAQVTEEPADKRLRMAWWLSQDGQEWMLEPREQVRGKKTWSKGRKVSLKRLSEEHTQWSHLTGADHKICAAIKHSYWGSGYWDTRETFSLSGYAALRACVGHPHVCLADDPYQPIDIAIKDPELFITQHSQGYRISIPELPEDFDEANASFSFTQGSRHHYRLMHFNDKHLEIAQIVGDKGLIIPVSAREKVLDSIRAISPLLNVISDIDGLTQDTGIEQIEADPRLYIDIQAQGQGLKFECHMQPLGVEGPRLLPGQGNPLIFAQIENKRTSSKRDLSRETQELDSLITGCPLFSYMDDHVLLLDDLEDALACLEQLASLQQQTTPATIVLLWPKGKAFSLKKPIVEQQIQLTVGKSKDWFSLDGEVSLAEGEVIKLKKLLSLIEKAPGRFIPMGDNEFLTLTDNLRQKLRDLNRATQQGGRFHAVAAPLIDDAISGMRVKSNKGWKEQVTRLKQSYELAPVLPPTLQAKLRDYQRDGYDWACRLAHWGAGACLADDMGLGKTLQALAVILSRAAQGPTLILAPTSVCFNWQEEAARFAPGLKLVLFSEGARRDRQNLLNEIGPFDGIVCSYGLLKTEGEKLAKVNWHTIIADEAQAIKNPQAKRTQAAMALSGQFKMITTGTPIENNLTELWSLFRFINPGLLGSKEAFNHNFASAIESAQGEKSAVQEASQGLKRLLSPFILRRLKTDVLKELPSRTEINLHVELSKEEKVFYEALRQRAMEKLAQTTSKPGETRIKVLAEIMRLRRACCHPSLIMEESNISSSKLKMFDELTDELRQNKHRALVFSQFVGHLSILRQHLDEKGVPYQYLDGSTPAPARKKAVNQFQAGEGDLFLISLKAGGSGLNLTAADYVIHMDPWWNPAVEDQASDRAHRLGQTRPVTIYRLITKNTIEDKIVALHQQKRDLANSLLAETGSGGTLSLNAMMALLQDEMV